MLNKVRPKRTRRKRRKIQGYRVGGIDERSLRGIQCRPRIYRSF